MAGFFVHRSNRMEELADVLARRLRDHPPADPMAAATVVVGSRGMERWLRHQLADRLGVCAQVAFRFPAQVLGEVLARLDPVPAPPGEPWAPDALVWTLLRCLASRWDHPDLAPVRRYLGEDHVDRPLDRRGYALVRELADLLDRLVHYRPDWVEAWSAGRQPEELAEADAAGWLALLWRAVEEDLGQTSLAARARRVAALLESSHHLEAGTGDLLVFGLSALPPLYLDLLALLGRVVRVDLFLLVPSDRFWGDLRTRAEARRLRKARRDDVADWLARDLERQNPLLTSLGRLARDLQLLLEEVPGAYQETEEAAFVDPAPPGEPGHRMLARLQSDVLHLESPASLAEGPGWDARAPALEDDSVRFHACHGPIRQVEVLREALLHLFEDHPHLEPRDVLVMTPDLETFAPLVTAVFGTRPGPGDPPPIPVAVADLGLRDLNPLADVLLRVLGLVEDRVTATAVMDLLAMDPVRRRFGVDADDLPALRDLVRDSGIRWGVDADDRAATCQQPPDKANTWRFGLERLALGAVMPDEGPPWHGVVPAGDAEGGRVALLGRFAAFVTTLVQERAELARPRPAAAWAVRLAATLDALAAPPPGAAWLLEQVRDELLALEAEAGPFPRPVAVGAVRHLLEGRLAAGRRGDRPVSGAVTVSALLPMRSVPFKVVCLLGMDDGAFPRAGGRSGLDPTADRPRLGDRDPRDEDRHLFLEAMLSAREHLLVFFTGRDPHTNERCPPAVPVGELLETLEAAFPPPDGAPAVAGLRDLLVEEHPLQPFSPRAFRQGPVPPCRPWSFDRDMLEVARALGAPRRAPDGLFAQGPLPALDGDRRDLTLAELVAFLRRPVRTLLNRRLGLYLGVQEDTLADREPVELDGLEGWSLGDRLAVHGVAALLARPGDPVDWRPLGERLVAEGILPLGAAGRQVLGAACGVADQVLARVQPLLGAAAGSRDVDLELAGVRLSGRIRLVAPPDRVLDVATDAPDKPRRLLSAWVHLLALAATQPGAEATLLGWSGGACGFSLRPPPDPAACLADLLALHQEGLVAPLPLFEKASHAFVKSLKGTAWRDAEPGLLHRALYAAEQAWLPSFGRDGEGDEPHLAAVYPERPPFRDGDGGGPDPAFADRAERVWGPLLAGLERLP